MEKHQKTILITGASGNLGQAVAERFHQAGFQVFGTDRSGASLPGITMRSLDLTNEAATQQFLQDLIQEQPQLNAAVMLVGAFAPGQIGQTDYANWQKMQQLNFSTALGVVQGLYDHFAAQGGGLFVFIGSRAAYEPAFAGEAVAYALSKALLGNLADIINARSKETGVRAAVVVPGTIDTPQNRAAQPNADHSKWVSVEAIAESIYFLFTPAGEQVRQAVIKVYNED